MHVTLLSDFLRKVLPPRKWDVFSPPLSGDPQESSPKYFCSLIYCEVLQLRLYSLLVYVIMYSNSYWDGVPYFRATEGVFVFHMHPQKCADSKFLFFFKKKTF